ncbi:hypothetical protein GAMM_330004 [Gammaproteobacteria bacterium]
MANDQVLSAEALQKLQTDTLGQFILDNSKFLEEMYHKLKGETLTEEVKEINGEKMLVPIWKNIMQIEPIMNEKGINSTMMFLNLSLTTNNATGNLQDETLVMLSYKTYTQLVKKYVLHLEEYGFKDHESAYEAAHLIFINVLNHLSKSSRMELLKQLMSSYFIQETRGSTSTNEQKPQANLSL